ncbi:hypothetical protein HYX10_05540 [Candidatus Woesearchaeota archaeon]|nr:hypothetical protein [Candidatus Woesearchaeota archaeon]
MAKRGQYSNTKIWFLVAAVLLAAVAGFDLLSDTQQRLSGTLLEKNFIARDVALTIEALYAAPGDVAYAYDLKKYMNKFFLNIGDGKVFVEAGSDEGDVSYRVVGSDKVILSAFKIYRVIDRDKPVRLIMSKKFNDDGTAIISFEAENARGTNE